MLLHFGEDFDNSVFIFKGDSINKSRAYCRITDFLFPLILKQTAGYTICLYLVLSWSPESSVTSKKTRTAEKKILVVPVVYFKRMDVV